MRLGFPVQVLGRQGIKSSDTRRWPNDPHLSVSLAYLRDILVYLEQIDVHMYRMSPSLAPYVTHPDLPRFHDQIAECATELAAVGALAKRLDVRLSVHPGAHVVLNSPDPSVHSGAVADLEAQATILDAMGLGDDAVVVAHVGGVYGDKDAAIARFIAHYHDLSDAARRRLALENDERAYTIADTFAISRETGIRLVLDQLHHLCNPAPGVSLRQALDIALGTWPADQTPKIHYSSPRTALIDTRRRGSEDHGQRESREPRLSQHVDLVDPFAFIDLLSATQDARDFDVMLECKAKDLALLRLRRHLARLAPDLAKRRSVR